MLKTIIIMVLTVQFIAHGADSTSVQVSGTVNLGCGGAINKSNPLRMYTFFKSISASCFLLVQLVYYS